MFELLEALVTVSPFTLEPIVRTLNERTAFIVHGRFDDGKGRITITVRKQVVACQIDGYRNSYRWDGKLWENVVTRELFYSFNVGELL